MSRVAGGGQGQGPSPYQEALKQYAPILFSVLFVLVVLALVRNCIDARIHPDENRPFDPVQNFGRTNASGLARLVVQGQETEPRKPASSRTRDRIEV